MAVLQGLCSFPGINAVVDASYTRGHGITPSACSITCAPQEDPISLGGDLVFSFGDAEVVFKNCKADAATARRNSDGLIWQIQILDRRWEWRFGKISGEYNRLDAKAQVIGKAGGSLPSSEKTPQELAKLLFEAMGEQDYDASALPSSARPYVLWEDDNPADALADLCEQLGCRVALLLDDTIKIVTIGEGADLPDDNTVMENSLAVDSPEFPDSIEVVGGPTLLQTGFLLEAVGKDTDGTWKLIDNLSYKPSGGWDAESNNFGSLTDLTQRKLALSTVFKCYRIKVNDSDESFTNYDGTIKVTNLAQILPVHATLVETYEDDGVQKPKSANVYGVFNAQNSGTPLNSNQTRTVSGGVTTDTTNPGTNFQFKGEFSVDEEHGIVVFNQPVRAWDSSASLNRRCTKLFVELVVTIRDPDTWEVDRYRYKYDLPGDKFGTGPEIVKKSDELQLKLFTQFDDQGNDEGFEYLVGPSDLDDLAKEFATCAAQKYEQPEAQDGTYAGLRDDIELDGAIQQITYSVGPAGATTRASRNSETHPYHPPYNAKRWKEKLSALAKRIGPYTATIRQPDNHINYGGNSMSFVKVGN